MSNRILITGGAGFIGSHLVDYFVERKIPVNVLDDFSIGKEANLQKALSTGLLKIVKGSILNDADINKAIKGCNIVFHLAVKSVRSSLSKPLENHDVNSTGTLKVLQQSYKNNVKRFIYCSSSEVYGNASDDLLDEEKVLCEPMTVYGASKLCGEYYSKAFFRTYGLPVIIIRPFNAYGPRAHIHGDSAEVIPRFIIRVLNDLPPVIFGNGENGRDFTHVFDVARGLAAAVDSDELIGKEVNIAYGKMMSVKDVALNILSLCNKNHLKPIFKDPRPGDVWKLKANTNLAKKLLGYSAKISFMDGLKSYVEWFKENYSNYENLLEEKEENWEIFA